MTDPLPVIFAVRPVKSGVMKTPTKEALSKRELLSVSYPLSRLADPIQVGMIRLMEEPARKHPINRSGTKEAPAMIRAPAARKTAPVRAVRFFKMDEIFPNRIPNAMPPNKNTVDIIPESEVRFEWLRPLRRNR